MHSRAAALRQKIGFWLGKFAYGVADQSAASGGNFLLNILLVRFFLPEQYGAFTIAFSVFLFLSGFHNAFILEPLSVIGPLYYSERLAEYLKVTIHLHFLLTLGMSALCFVIFLVCRLFFNWGQFLFSGLFSVSFAMPFILFFWLTRRVCYLEQKAHVALVGSGVYLFFVICGLFFLRYWNILGLFNIFLLLALTSILGSGIIWLRLGLSFRDIFKAPAGLLNTVTIQHWNYGKWTAGLTLPSWICLDFYFILIASILGLAQTAVFRALQNLFMPLNQLLGVIGLFMVPWFSHQRSKQGNSYVRSKIFPLTAIYALFAVCYVSLILIYKDSLLKLLYNNSYYSRFAGLLPYLALAAVVSALWQPLSNILRVMEKPKVIFFTKTVAMAYVLIFGVASVYFWGFYGAITSIIVSTLIELMIFGFYLKKKLAQPI